jgi:hypothetical protein
VTDLTSPSGLHAWVRAWALRLHDPFEEVWRGKPAHKTRNFSHIFHNSPTCPRMSRFHDVRSSRLAALIDAGWWPCRSCFPEFFLGGRQWERPPLENRVAAEKEEDGSS